KLDVRIAAFSILGALNWTAEWYSPEGPDSVDELGEKIADTLLSGLVYSGRDVEIVDGRPAAKTRAGKKS
ncbi:MAG TPA: hypothetical protein PKD04_09745, partial [Rhodocyclaceae bacterium]|nr:hypothetical protein [Rhodocyclaceae bacterium]